MDIGDVRRELVPEINDGYTTLTGGGPIGELGYVYEDLGLQLEALGICYLLEDADQEGFRERLVRAGHARRWFLKRSSVERNTSDFHLALTRQNGFFDALAAGHVQLAGEIAAASPFVFNPQWEYEDDFAYQAFLMSMTLPGMPPTLTRRQREMLERFEKALEGDDSPRLEVCKAFGAKDAGAFDAAFTEFLEAEQAVVDEDRESERVLEGDLCYWPTSYVSIEGLALLKLAEHLGLPAKGPYPRCPELGRLGWTNRVYEDYFELISTM